jgi:archaellin
MSGIIILIVFAALALWGAVSSIVAIGRDGYRQSPTRINGATPAPNRY